MITVVFFLFISLAVMFGMVNPTLTETKLARSLAYSSQSYFLSEGGIEDVLYRLKIISPLARRRRSRLEAQSQRQRSQTREAMRKTLQRQVIIVGTCENRKCMSQSQRACHLVSACRRGRAVLIFKTTRVSTAMHIPRGLLSVPIQTVSGAM